MNNQEEYHWQLHVGNERQWNNHQADKGAQQVDGVPNVLVLGMRMNRGIFGEEDYSWQFHKEVKTEVDHIVSEVRENLPEKESGLSHKGISHKVRLVVDNGEALVSHLICPFVISPVSQLHYGFLQNRH